MYKRDEYLKKIRNLYHEEKIKVLTGMRKTGKTVILKQVINELRELGINEEYIIYINFDYLVDEQIKDYLKLYYHIKELIKSESKYYIFIDEIQNVKSYEKAILSIKSGFNTSIFITSSNLLTDEFKTILEGEYISFNVNPFSYSEWLESIKSKPSNKMLMDFLVLGGLPQLTNIKDLDTRMQSLNDILNSIILKDIIERVNINNVILLQKLIDYVIQNTSDVLSVQSILKYLKTINISVSNDTIYTYLNYIKNSFLVYECKKYDLNNKKTLSKIHKLYVNDLGLMINSKNADLSKMIETVVYNHLKYLGYKIYYTYIGEYDIDFYITKVENGITVTNYVKVAYKLKQGYMIDGKIKPFSLVSEDIQKYIISMNEYDLSTDTAKHIKLSDFLLDNEF